MVSRAESKLDRWSCFDPRAVLQDSSYLGGRAQWCGLANSGEFPGTYPGPALIPGRCSKIRVDFISAAQCFTGEAPRFELISTRRPNATVSRGGKLGRNSGWIRYLSQSGSASLGGAPRFEITSSRQAAAPEMKIEPSCGGTWKLVTSCEAFG